MKYLFNSRILIVFISFMSLMSCSSDDDDDNMMIDPPDKPVIPARTTVYNLGSLDVPNITGTATFTENPDNTVTIEIDLENTQEGDQHPAHIHANTAAEDGPILLTLGVVDGSTGKSSVTIGALDDGTAVNYDTLITLDGAINVHLVDTEDLFWTIVAQGDIGQNVLTGMSQVFDLKEKMVPGIDGTVTFYERLNGEALSVIELQNTPEGGEHPAHIHNNSAAEGGGIAFSFNPIDGTSGLSRTNVATLDDGSSFGYADVINFDGYINVHLSVDDLATIVAQGDIGENELTGNTITYSLNEKDAPGISGEVVFYERMSGEALAKISLMNTPMGGVHPAHIHNNAAATGGGIAFSFNPINGDTGMSDTHVSMLDDGSSFGYDDVSSFDGYINVHLSVDALATIVAQGDIGENELTGNTITYSLNEKDAPGISGEVVFYERMSGEALAKISLMNTPMGGVHPAHIHNNDVATGGGIAFSFNPVNGDTGMSSTHVSMLDDGTLFGYGDVDSFMGYINVHLSADQLGTIVAQGNIGASLDEENIEVTTAFNVTNSGPSAYIFNNDDLNEASNPDLTLKRGQTYQFIMNSPGHPFFIKNQQATGTGDAYNSGVTNNGASDEMITFTVPLDAPNTLFYICEFHASMTGTFTIVD